MSIVLVQLKPVEGKSEQINVNGGWGATFEWLEPPLNIAKMTYNFMSVGFFIGMKY